MLAFRALGYDIRQHHSSTALDVAAGATGVPNLRPVCREPMYVGLRTWGPVYEVGVLEKRTGP